MTQIATQPKYALIDEAERTAFIVTYLLRASVTVGVITGTAQQKEFFEAALPHFNIPENRFRMLLLASPDPQALSACTSLLLVDAPQRFEEVAALHAQTMGRPLLLLLFAKNAGYLAMLHKHFPEVSPQQLRFNPNKLLPTESKLRHLVEGNYRLNRLAFYAYGSFLRHFAGNLLRATFRTELLDVAKVARSFGFAVPPRVTAESAKFLNKKTQDKLKHQKRRKRLLRKRALKAQARTEKQDEEAQEKGEYEAQQPKSKQPPKKKKKIAK